jgi:ceramide glucosyltransferase
MSGPDLTSSLVALGDLCLAGAVVGCIFTLLACAFVLGFGGEGIRRSSAQQGVTVLKPLHGAEPELAARLARYCAQDYAGPLQIVFGARDDDGHAVAVARAIKAEFPDLAIELAVSGRDHGGNRKVSNLINMHPYIRHDTLVVSDSDIVVGPGYLRGLTALLEPPHVGAVTCLYHGIASEGVWSRLSSLAINTQFLPQAITATGLGIARHCCGATIALRRSVLDRIGGFAAFADALADDYALGTSVRSLGYEVVTAPFLVGHCCYEANLRQLVRHQLRVARTIRNIEPLGYVGSIITHPWPLALIGVVSGSSTATLVAAAALVSRLALCRCVERRFGLPRQSYWLIPLQDVIAFAVYVASFFGASVHWQGSDYRVTADGALIEQDFSKG